MLHPLRTTDRRSIYAAIGLICFALLVLSSRSHAFAADEVLGPEPGEGYTAAGQIQPRPATQIRASNWSIGAETMDRDFTVYKHWREYLGPLGVKKARIQSGWAKTERERGSYEWAWLDEIIPDMVQQGVEPWVCLCYGNPIYEGGGGTGLGGGLPTSDEALAAWDRYVAATVDRYKQHVDEWEIWNEPGLRGVNPAAGYAAFLVRTAEVVRRQQPDARIVGFAMAGIKNAWVDEILKIIQQQGKLDLIDELTYHPYSYNPDDSYTGVLKLRELVHSYSPRIAIRQGENGAPSQRGSFGALADYDWTELRQAKWALRRLLGDLGRDVPSSYFAICDMQYPDRTNYKGLLAINADKTVDHPKVGYRAVQHLTAVFDDRLQRIPDFSASVSGGGEKSRYSVFGYRDGDGRQVVTLWRSSGRPGAQEELENLQLIVEQGQFQDPVWVDLISGRVFEIDDSLWSRTGDTITFTRVPVYDSVILIADRPAISHALK
jgi:hypothetical protein